MFWPWRCHILVLWIWHLCVTPTGLITIKQIITTKTWWRSSLWHMNWRVLLPWIAPSSASSLNPGKQTVTQMGRYKTFPTPLSILENRLHQNSNSQTVLQLILWSVKTSSLIHRPSLQSQLCGLKCLPADCVCNTPKTTVSSVALLSPLPLPPVRPFTKLISLLIHL